MRSSLSWGMAQWVTGYCANMRTWVQMSGTREKVRWWQTITTLILRKQIPWVPCMSSQSGATSSLRDPALKIKGENNWGSHATLTSGLSIHTHTRETGVWGMPLHCYHACPTCIKPRLDSKLCMSYMAEKRSLVTGKQLGIQTQSQRMYETSTRDSQKARNGFPEKMIWAESWSYS